MVAIMAFHAQQIEHMLLWQFLCPAMQARTTDTDRPVDLLFLEFSTRSKWRIRVRFRDTQGVFAT